MKAVVMELREGRAAVLDHNGVFRITEDHHYKVGQILEIPEEIPQSQGKILSFRQKIRRHVLPAAAAAAVTILATGGGVAAFTVPVTSVTVEMDSKYVYQLNMMDRVLSVRAKDPDKPSPDHLQSVVKGKKLDEAMDITLELLSENGEIGETDTPMNVTVESRFGKQAGLEKTVEKRVELWNDRQAEDSPHTVQVIWEPRPVSAAPSGQNSTIPKEMEAHDDTGSAAFSGNVFEQSDAVQPGNNMDPGVRGGQSGPDTDGQAGYSTGGRNGAPAEDGNPAAALGALNPDTWQSPEREEAVKKDNGTLAEDDAGWQKSSWSELPGQGDMGGNTDSPDRSSTGMGEGAPSESFTGAPGSGFGDMAPKTREDSVEGGNPASGNGGPGSGGMGMMGLGRE